MTDLETVVLEQLRAHEVASCWRMAQENGSSVDDVNAALHALQAKGMAKLAPTSTKNRRYTPGGTHWMPVTEQAPSKGQGIHSLHDLMLRCVVDEETGCWKWAGGHSNGKHPALRMPALNCTVSLGTAICFLKTGKRPAKGTCWHVICTTPNCANPEHREEGNRKSQMLSPAAKKITPLRAAKLTLAHRARSANCDEQVAAEIRASKEPAAVISARTGVSVGMVSKIRTGVNWRPVVVRQSSVFTGALA